MTIAATQRIMDIAMTLPDEAEEPIVNFMANFKRAKQPVIDVSKRTDIADSGMDFGPNITDENHDERMAHVFSLADGIEIDEQAIKDLREASLI